MKVKIDRYPDPGVCRFCRTARGYHMTAVNPRVRPEVQARKRELEEIAHYLCTGPDSCTCNHDMTRKGKA